MLSMNNDRVASLLSMIEFSPPILEHFCPLLVHVAQMGLILPKWGLTLPRIPPQHLFFTQLSQTSFGDMYVHKTPQAHPKTPIFLESGQNQLLSGQNGSQLGKMFEKWAKPF